MQELRFLNRLCDLHYSCF